MANQVMTEDAARRLAKTIMQDIGLYNAEKIRAGLENDSVFEILADELNEGRNLYNSRVAPEILQRTNFFERAINDYLIREALLRNQGQIKSKIA